MQGELEFLIWHVECLQVQWWRRINCWWVRWRCRTKYILEIVEICPQLSISDDTFSLFSAQQVLISETVRLEFMSMSGETMTHDNNVVANAQDHIFTRGKGSWKIQLFYFLFIFFFSPPATSYWTIRPLLVDVSGKFSPLFDLFSSLVDLLTWSEKRGVDCVDRLHKHKPMKIMVKWQFNAIILWPLDDARKCSRSFTLFHRWKSSSANRKIHIKFIQDTENTKYANTFSPKSAS